VRGSGRRLLEIGNDLGWPDDRIAGLCRDPEPSRDGEYVERARRSRVTHERARATYG
jgi:hypothetical protein